MELMSLLVRLGISGQSQVTSGLRTVQNEAKRTEQSAKSMSSALGGAFDSVLGKVGHITGTIAAVGALGTTLGAISGTRASSEIGSVTRQLEIITGRADTARSSIRKLLDTSRSTPFETRDVLNFGRGLIDQYGAEVGTRRAGNLVRLYQGLGGTAGEFGRYQTNVQQIGTRGSKQVEADDVQSLLDTIPIVTLASRKMGLSLDEANRKLRTMSGNDLLGFLESLGKDMKAQRPQDVFGAATQAAKTFSEAMAPTGAIINSTLTPFLNKVSEAIGLFGRLNELSGGKAGLVLVFGAAVLGVRLFTRALAEASLTLRGIGMLGFLGGVGTGTAAKTAVTEAAGAVARGAAEQATKGGAAAMARGAAGAPARWGAGLLNKRIWGKGDWIGQDIWDNAVQWGQMSHAEKLRDLSGRNGWNAMRSTWSVLRDHLITSSASRLSSVASTAKATVPAATTWGARIANGFKALLTPLNLIPLGLDLGFSGIGGYITGKGNPKFGKTLSGIGSGIGWGAAGGAIIGSIVPVIGTTVGAVIGAVIGAGIGGYRGYKGGSADEKKSAATVAQKQLSETKKQTQILENISLQMIGGGNRSRRAGDILAIEYAMYNAQWRNSII